MAAWMYIWNKYKEDRRLFDQKNRFVIDHCQKNPTFSSFLPGIAGPKGIPAWVYYNNRG